MRDASGTTPARLEVGLKPIRSHAPRHSAATQQLEKGASHFAVSVQLGHEDGGALVMSRYGHPSKDVARAGLLAALELAEAVLVAGRLADPAANGVPRFERVMNGPRVPPGPGRRVPPM